MIFWPLKHPESMHFSILNRLARRLNQALGGAELKDISPVYIILYKTAAKGSKALSQAKKTCAFVPFPTKTVLVGDVFAPSQQLFLWGLFLPGLGAGGGQLV